MIDKTIPHSKGVVKRKFNDMEIFQYMLLHSAMCIRMIHILNFTIASNSLYIFSIKFLDCLKKIQSHLRMADKFILHS